MDNHPASSSRDDAPQILEVRIVGAKDIPAQYVNIISTNLLPDAIQVVIAQAFPPMVLTQMDADEAAERGYIEAPAVAHLVLTPIIAQQFIDNLQGQLDRMQGNDISNGEERFDD